MAGSTKDRATEHSGAKHGNGAYYGPKAIAKHYSNKERRRRDAEVWADVLAEPGFEDELRKGQADLEAGRWYSLDTTTGKTTPNPDWPKDGPQPT